MDSSFGEDGTQRVISENIVFPENLDGVALTWTSDKPEFLSAEGLVNRGDEDVEVTLTVVMKYGRQTRELKYEVAVKALEYTISFDSAGGSFVESVSAKANAEITKPEDPTREGHVFVGWFEEGAEEEFAFMTMPKRNVRLYARWEECRFTAGLKFELDEEGNYYVFEYEGTSPEVTIPSTYRNKPVTAIGAFAFYQADFLESITLPETIKVIGDCAFKYCDNLKNINLPEGFLKIGGNAFQNCASLETIVLPESLTYIGGSAFLYCTKLKTITLPENLTTLGADAFANCTSLESIVIPEKVTSLEKGLFFGCENLKNVTLPKNLTNIEDLAFYGCTDLETIALPEKLTKIGPYAFYKCANLESIDIPEGVTSIERYAFYGCEGLRKVNLPDGLASIGNQAFYDCKSLKSIFLPESVLTIGDHAFTYCDDLVICAAAPEMPGGWDYYWIYSFHDVEIPVHWGVDEVQEEGGFEYFVFEEGAAITRYFGDETKLAIPVEIGGHPVQKIGAKAFFGCANLLSATIPESVSIIEKNAFSETKATIYAQVASRPNSWSVFWNGNRPAYFGVEEVLEHECLEYIVVYGNALLTRYLGSEAVLEIPTYLGDHYLTGIGDSAFEAKKDLVSVSIPDSVSDLGEYAFTGCTNLENVTLSFRIEKIKYGTFMRCTSLKRIVISEQVKEIHAFAFSHCTSLKSIHLPENVYAIDRFAFYGSTNLVFYVQADSEKSDWDENWNNLNRPVYFGVDEILEYNGLECLLLDEGIMIARYVGDDEELVLPAAIGEYQVTGIGDRAFENCALLSKLYVPLNIEKIGSHAFLNCTNLAIYASATAKPAGWSGDWNPDDRPVHWGNEGWD